MSAERLSPGDVIVVIPGFNEGRVIGTVVAEVVRAGYAVVVIDDGSSDDTAGQALAAGATVLRHPINCGQGAALQTGIDFALQQQAAAIVTFDADGQHRAAEISRLLEALGSGADFALGSRFLGAAVDAPRSRLLLLRAAVWFTRFTTGLRLTDAHNGFRAMSRRGALRIRLTQSRMAHASEILNQIASSGMRYVEVPVTIQYSRYSLAKGQSFGDAILVLVDLLARRLHR